MPEDDALATMYAQLIALYRHVFDTGHDAIAYHALAAALHCAADVGDAMQLAEVAAIAQDNTEQAVNRRPKRIACSSRVAHLLTLHAACART